MSQSGKLHLMDIDNIQNTLCNRILSGRSCDTFEEEKHKNKRCSTCIKLENQVR